MKRWMRHFYYYIPPCPRCGSRCTGRFVTEPKVGRDQMEEESLKNGEIIRFARTEPVRNAFCVDCGYRWGSTASLKFLSAEKIQEEIDARGTEEAYLEISRLNKLANAERNKEKRHSLLSFILR